MAKTALIIEDDESQARALQALCQKLGVEAAIARNGKEGHDQARASPPDLILLDLLLPGMDGFKVAESLRSSGVKSALVVLSGVYKDPKVAKELSDKHGADFFQKPFKVEELTACLSRRLGLATAPAAAPAAAPRRPTLGTAVVPPMEGSLQDKPFPALLLELSRAKASGTLDLTQGQVKKRVFLYCGQVRFAQSNVKAENVGGMQVVEGTLSEEQFRAAVARARQEHIGIGEALAVAGALSWDALAKAVRRQVEEVCLTAYGWAEGTYRFAPGPTDKIQDVRHDPVALLLGAVKRFVTADQAKARLAPWLKGTISRAPDFDRALFTIRSVFAGETVTPLVNGRLTVAEVVARARPDDLPLLWALVQLNLSIVVGAEPEKKADARPAGPARAHTPEEEAARMQIIPEYERVMAAPNFFAVLRLTNNASIEEVKASYLTLAKRFHANSFAGLDLGDATEKLRELFARISEAHATLSDPKRRADYLILLERQEAGLPTDVEVIFRAEACFNRGDALIKQGRFADAETALKEALKLDPSVAQYHVGLAQALLKGRGAAGVEEARKVLDQALALNPDHSAAKLLKAHALELGGDPKAALKVLSDTYAADPSNEEAAREYRALKERMRKSEGKGLLGKLFKR